MLPLVLLAATVVAGFVLSSSSLNQGLRNQISHTNSNNLSFNIAYSVLSQTLAKIHANSWVLRPFAVKPYVENNVAFNNGTYDLFVEDSPGKKYQADIYVRTTLAQTTSMFFWRIRFQDDLLDVSNRILVDFFMRGDPAEFPKTSGSTFAGKIDDLMNKRKGNQKNSDDSARAIGQLNTPQEVLSVLNGRPMDALPAKIPPAGDGPESMILAKGKNPLSQPQIAPPTIGEAPDSPGPGPTTPLTGQPSTPGGQGSPSSPSGTPGNPAFPSVPPSSTDLSGLAALGSSIQEAAKQSKSDMEATLGNYQAGQVDAGNLKSQSSYQAASIAYDSMNTMIQRAKELAGNAPGSDAAAAIQQMVGNTGVSSLQTMSQQMALYGNDVVNPNTLGAMNPSLTSAQMEEILGEVGKAGSRLGVGILETQLASMKSIADQVGPFAKDPDIQAALNDTIAAAQAVLDSAKAELAKAEAIVAQKRAEEAAAAAAATNTDTGTGTGTGT